MYARYVDCQTPAAISQVILQVLLQEDLDNLMAAGLGAAPGILFAQGVPADPTPDPNSFDRKVCSFILFEIGFCRDLGCHEKVTEKTEKYYPLF